MSIILREIACVATLATLCHRLHFILIRASFATVSGGQGAHQHKYLDNELPVLGLISFEFKLKNLKVLVLKLSKDDLNLFLFFLKLPLSSHYRICHSIR